MSIITHKTPDNIEFSRKAITIEVSNDDYYFYTPEYSKFKIPNELDAGYGITFPLPSKNSYIHFDTFDDDTIDDNSYSININAPGSLADKLRSHPEVREEYIIEETDTDIIFTCQTYTRIISDDISCKAGKADRYDDLSSVISTGYTGNINQYLIMYAELLNPGYKAGEGIVYNLEGQKPYIQIQEAVLKNYPFPDNSADIKVIPIPEITLLIQELQDRTYKPRWDSKEIIFNALPGHADKSIFQNTTGNAKTNLLNNLNTYKLSETNELFINYSIQNRTDLKVKTILHYENYNTTEITTDKITIPDNSTIRIPAGWQQMELNNQTPYKYEIFLISDNNIESEKTTVYLVPYNYRETIFLYYNKYGLPETLRTTGGQNTEINVNKTEYIANNEMHNHFEEATQEHSVQTGLKHIKEEEAIKDIVKSQAVWVKINNTWQECNIKDDTFTIIEKSETTINIKFTYKLKTVL